MSRKKATTTKRRAAKGSATANTQAKLITNCIAFVQMRAAYSAGYKADPDGNSKNATRSGEPYYRKATLALASIAMRDATTVEALRAKSSVAEVLLDEADECGFRTDRLDVLFLTHFAKDVKGFARLLIEQKWVAESSSSNTKNAA